MRHLCSRTAPPTGLHPGYAHRGDQFLLRIAVFLGSSAIGLLVAPTGRARRRCARLGSSPRSSFSPSRRRSCHHFFLKMASRYASTFLGGIGLVSTLAALILASLFSSGISIRGIGSWIAVTVLVRLVTLATLVLPVLVLKKGPGAS